MPNSPTLDVDRILADARALAFPRYPGTPGDARAIDWVAEKLRDAGLEMTRQEFRYDVRPAFRALRALLIGAALLVAGGGLLANQSLAGAAALVLVALVGGGVFLAWSPALERIYERDGPTTTANVMGRRRAERPRRTLVLLAHHDSKSQNLTLPLRLALTVGAVAGAVGLAGLLVTGVVHGDLPGPTLLPQLSSALGALSLLALATLRSGNDSPGGVDNAGSVAILLELARRLPPLVPADVDLVFLSTGAEEDHMVGAMRWLDVHLPALDRPVWALNIDGAGLPGRVALLERYGLGRRFSARLSRVARRAAERLRIPVRGVLLPPALGVDAIPFAHRGVDCLTLASGSLCTATLAVHSAGDVAENLDRDALSRVAQLASEVALDLARESHP